MKKSVLFFIVLFSLCQITFSQSVSALIEAYTGDISWDSSAKKLTFNTTGTMDFPDRELLYNNVWTLPDSVQHVVIEKNVTVTGEFYANYSCLIEGKDWETSVVYGTSEQNYLDQSRGFSAFYAAEDKVRVVDLNVKNLTSLNPKVYHFTGSFRGRIHLDHCRVIDDRGGRWNNSDGFQGAHGSTVKDSYFETGEDVIKAYGDMLVENTTINMIEFAVPIQCGWGDYGSGITATFKNLKIIGNLGRSPENAIIEARQGNYTKNIIIDGLTVENPNASMFRLQQAASTINVEITNADIKLKKYGDIVLAQGTRSICGTTEIKTEYKCSNVVPRFNVTNLKSRINNTGAVELTWAESNTDEVGYIIERAKASDDDYEVLDTVNPDVVSYTDSSPDEFTLYKYRVKAKFDDEVLDPDNVVLARTQKNMFTTLPSPWQSIALGSTAVNLASDAVFENDTFTIDAGDGDFWTAICRGHFIYQKWQGNGQIIAKIQDFDHVQSFSMAGVMIRETLDDGAKFGAQLMISDPGPVMRERSQTDGAVNQKPFPNTAEKAPYWVKLVRIDDLFIGYTSSNGIDWVKTREVTIDMAEDTYIGMVANTHTETAIGNYSFKNVEVTKDVSLNTKDLKKTNNEFLVYPNPVSDKLFVDYKLTEQIKMVIYAINGSKIKSKMLKNGRNTISLENVARGIYFLKIEGKDNNTIKKIVVE